MTTLTVFAVNSSTKLTHTHTQCLFLGTIVYQTTKKKHNKSL